MHRRIKLLRNEKRSLLLKIAKNTVNPKTNELNTVAIALSTFFTLTTCCFAL